MPAISLTQSERTLIQQTVSRYMAHHNTEPALFLGGREVVMILTPFSRARDERPVPLTRKQAALALAALKAEAAADQPGKDALEQKLAAHAV